MDGASLAGVGGAASTTGIGAVPGVPAMVGGGLLIGSGYDNFSTGLSQLWTGEGQTTAVQRAAGGVAQALGASPETAQTVETVAGAVQGAAGGAGSAVAAALRAGKTAAAEAKAVESGVEGARSTRAGEEVKPKILRRSIAERRKALLRDAEDPNSKLTQEQRDFIRSTNGERLPPGLEVSHEVPLYTGNDIAEKQALDKSENMIAMDKSEHRARHVVCGDQYHDYSR